MILDIRAFKDPFNSHLEEPGVWYQFVLNEFLKLYRLSKDFSILESTARVEGNTRKVKSKILKILQDLTGENHKFSNHSPWHEGLGLYPRLTKYYSHYPRRMHIDSKPLTSLYNVYLKSFLACTELYRTLQSTKEIDSEELITTTIPHVAHLVALTLRKTKTFIIKSTWIFHHNENVLFYILRHNSQFKTIYGTEFLHKFFPDSFNGFDILEEIESYTKKNYRERGFFHLADAIDLYAAELR